MPSKPDPGIEPVSFQDARHQKINSESSFCRKRSKMVYRNENRNVRLPPRVSGRATHNQSMAPRPATKTQTGEGWTI